MRALALAGCLLLWLAPPHSAQPAPRQNAIYYAGPKSGASQSARSLPLAMRSVLPPPHEFALASAAGFEPAAAARQGAPLRVGIHREMPDEATGAGSWDVTGDGRSVWRLAIRSAGARSLRLEFQDFDAGAGEVWIYTGEETDGPYTGRGPFADGHFWSGILAGDSVIVAYEPEAGRGGQPTPFRIRSVSHQALPFASDGVREATPAASGCHLDPSCYPEWRDTMNTVAHLVFEEDGHQYVCSGSLLATRNSSMKPYLLTAGHCIHDEATARTVQAYWTYQTSTCGAAPPLKADSRKSSAGASLLASAGLGQGDFSLLLLRDIPAGVWFAGWDAADPPLGSSLTGIHHPRGSYKRISFGRRVPDGTAIVDSADAPSGLYLRVLWSRGHTEPGSSGSPLFSGPGVVVGLLSYGPDAGEQIACELLFGPDGYGRFSNIYAYLRDYLEDLPAATVAASPSDLEFRGVNGAIDGADSRIVTLRTQSTGAVEFKARADAPWIRLSPPSGALSAAAPASLTVSVDPAYLSRAGRYSGTVTILSGAAAPRFLNVRVEMAVQRSDVAAALIPNPVLEQTDGAARWTFRIRLEEKGGAATRLTSLKINGTDYSPYIGEWFGSDRLDAMGSLETTLRSDGPFPRGDQYFEFGGRDEAGGGAWRRTLAVPFIPAQP